MNFALWVFFILTISLCISVSSQAILNVDPVCYGSSCPLGTTRCKKHMKSESNGYIAITVNCLDDEDGSLKTYYFQEPTTLSRNTQYESTSYTSIGGRSTFSRFDGYGRNNNVEEFMP